MNAVGTIQEKIGNLKTRKVSLGDELVKLDSDIQKKRESIQRALVDGRPVDKLSDELVKLETRRQGITGAQVLIQSAVSLAGDELKAQELENARRELTAIGERLDAQAVEVIQQVYAAFYQNKAFLNDLRRANVLARKLGTNIIAFERPAVVIAMYHDSLRKLVYGWQFTRRELVDRAGVKKVKL